MKHIRFITFILALILLGLGTSWADSIILSPVDDVYWLNPNTNPTTVPTDDTFLRAGGGTSYRQSAIKFDLTVIPNGSTINSATLSLYQSGSTPGSTPASARNVHVYYSSDDNWNDSVIPVGGPAEGAFLGEQLSGTTGWKTWDLLAGGWSPEADLLDNFLTLRLRPHNVSYNATYTFHSSNNTTNRPYMTLDYTPVVIPIPGSLLLLGSGLVGLGLLGKRRRFWRQ